jgi:hemoglobin-like flavoprotein
MVPVRTSRSIPPILTLSCSVLDTRSLFRIAPKAKDLFRLSDGDDMKSNPLFFKHARAMVDMIDCAVGFLGPDMDPLTEDLIGLGQRHIAYGVLPEYLPIMSTSLNFALEKILKERFTEQDQKSWDAVMNFMISKMIMGMNK